MESEHIEHEALLPHMARLEAEGKTVMLIAADGKAAGLIAVADTIKETSPAAVKRLNDMGLDVIMMTGDNKKTAEAIAKAAGIGSVIAEVLPEQKAAEISRLQKKAGAWRWSVTASMMLRRWLWPISEWPSAPAPISQWKQRTLR